jgi:hypothetical protein
MEREDSEIWNAFEIRFVALSVRWQVQYCVSRNMDINKKTTDIMRGLASIFSCLPFPSRRQKFT